MREFREYGSARGALSNERPYRDPERLEGCSQWNFINPFISISTFTRHIVAMVFDRKSGFWLGCFAIAALTSEPYF